MLANSAPRRRHAPPPQILSDEDKRILYDTGGEDAVAEADKQENAPASPFGA